MHASREERRGGAAAGWIVAAAALFSVVGVSTGWTHNLLDAHGFRQTQTAISTQYLLEGSSVFAYETPVLGPPWAIPFEFPLYQGLVALVVSIARVHLEPAGRLVSVAFFYLTLLPLWDALRSLGVPSRARLIFLAFVLVSPLYLFWSRTFMIESTALFFSVAYFALSMRALGTGRRAAWAGAVLCGCVAGVVKLTTLYGFWIAAAGYAAWMEWRERRIDARRVLSALALLGVPVVVSLAWTRFADSQRALNPFADFLVASELNQWMFGTLEQRLSIYPTWWALGVRTIAAACGSLAFYATAVSILWSRRYIGRYVASVALYLAVVMTFTNLHVVHEYYPYAAAIFVIAAQAFAIASLLEGDARQRAAGMAMAIVLVVFSVWSYLANEYALQRVERAGIAPFAREVEAMSQPGDVLIVYGLDWSPELPYYAKRRALMIRAPQALTREAVDTAKAAIAAGGYRAGPLIACGIFESYARVQAELWGLNANGGVNVRGCRVYR